MQTEVTIPLAAETNPGVPLELGAIYRQHAELVKRWALRLGGPSVDAEDIAHEVFLVAHRRLHEFRGDAKMTTWLYRITLRVTRDHGRRRTLGRWLRGLVGDFARRVPGQDLGPYESLERQRSAVILYRALDELNHNQRTAIILHDLEGHSGEEIADLMQTKVATVHLWLHRGRAKFRERMKELESPEKEGSA